MPFVIVLYVLGFALNFFVTLKYPDGDFSTAGIVVSNLYFLALAYFLYKNSQHKIIKRALPLLGLLSLLIAIFHAVDNMSFLVSGIRDGLSLLFVAVYAPLFGINALFNLSIGWFAALMGGIFVAIWLIAYKKKQPTS